MYANVIWGKVCNIYCQGMRGSASFSRTLRGIFSGWREEERDVSKIHSRQLSCPCRLFQGLRGYFNLTKGNYPKIWGKSYNPGQNVWDTLRFSWGKCNSGWPPPPLNSVGCYKSNTFYISCTLYGPQLCLGGWGKNLVKAVFMSVYRRLAANSIQNQVKKGRCPKTFWPGL